MRFRTKLLDIMIQTQAATSVSGPPIDFAVEAAASGCDVHGPNQDRILHIIAEGTSQVGPAFFPAFVRSLASALGVECVLVAECLDRPTTKVRTLAFWQHGHLGDNVEYPLEGTPCKDVCEGTEPYYPCEIQKLFPADLDLVALGAESYCGLPLRDSAGQIIGHLAILDGNRLTENFNELPALRIFAARAASELQRKLAEEHKMAAVGQLTDCIAHEMNTPVGVVQSSASNLELCVGKILEAVESSEALDELRRDRGFLLPLELIRENSRALVAAGARIAKVVGGLKKFSSEDDSQECANVRSCVEGAVTLVARQTPNGVTIDRRLADIPCVRMGPAQISQVLATLLSNAAEAIHGHGTITVETGVEGSCALIRISDTGVGIGAGKLKTLFDFGFTTKGNRVGASMGLACVYSIVQRHNGRITVASNPGEGTTFTILLPTTGG